MSRELVDLLSAGLSRQEVARRLGVSASTVTRRAAQLGLPPARPRSSAYDWAAVQRLHDAGASPTECRQAFGFSTSGWEAAVIRGDIRPNRRPRRSTSGPRRFEVARLRAAGLSSAATARELGISPATVAYHLRALGYPADERFARRFPWPKIQEAYDAGLSARDCRARFGCSAAAWSDAVRRGELRPKPRALPLEVVLVSDRRTNRHHLRHRLVEAGLKDPSCETCGLERWQGRPIALQLHHLNGDGLDNRLGNLQILCPNCHSQTDTWGARNVRRCRERVAAEARER